MAHTIKQMKKALCKLPPKRRWLVTSLLVTWLLSSPTHAEIYKWVDEKGNVHYSDRVNKKQKPEEQKPIELQPLPTISAPKTTTAVPSPLTDPPKANVSSYQIQISQPTNDTTFPPGFAGSFTVSTTVAPELDGEHQLQLIVDGKPHGSTQSSLVLQASNLNRGEHQIRVIAIDQSGKTISSSATVRVFILRSTVFNKSSQVNTAPQMPQAPQAPKL